MYIKSLFMLSKYIFFLDQTSINNIVKDKRTNTELHEFFIQRANKLFAQSRFNGALESYIKAKEMLTSEENDVKIQCDIIECYLNMKDYKRALELCLSIIESSCGSGIEKVFVLLNLSWFKYYSISCVRFFFKLWYILVLY